jgi:hypothetical protein
VLKQRRGDLCGRDNCCRDAPLHFGRLAADPIGIGLV